MISYVKEAFPSLNDEDVNEAIYQFSYVGSSVNNTPVYDNDNLPTMEEIAKTYTQGSEYLALLVQDILIGQLSVDELNPELLQDGDIEIIRDAVEDLNG